MTRKQAISAAIAIIQKADIDVNTRDEIISKLLLCIEELPFAKWTEAAIFDACDQYCLDHNRSYLISSDFQKASLPSHPTIKNRFGMKATEFRDKYYPLPNNTALHNVYTRKTHEAYTQDFIEQYNKTAPSSADEYDKQRPDGYPCWYIIAQMNDEKAWVPLLNKLGLGLPQKKGRAGIRKGYTVTSTSRSGSVEKLKDLLEL